MFAESLQFLALRHRKKRMSRRRAPEVAPLEARRLLSSVMDLTTAATVTTITNGVPVVQPMKTAYATNADSMMVNFSTSDPDDSGPAPTTHFNVTDVTTGTVVVSNGTGSSLTLSQPDVYQVQYWSTDSDDSEAMAAHSTMIAIDRTAPTITINTVNPNVLWPPNGKFVTVTVTGVASDSLSGVDASSLGFHVVDEYGTVEPSGSITDITPTGPNPFGGFANVGFTFQVMLQARRHGFDFDGRQYVIDVTASDMAGNTGLESATAIVPHDMGRHHGFHGTGQEGPSRNGGAKHHDRGTHGHGGQGDVGGSPTSGGVIVIGVPPISGTGQGNGNGNDQGNGNGHGNGNSHGHGSGNGNGNADQGNGTDNGLGDGNGQGNGDGQGNGNGHGNGNRHGHGNGNGKNHG
jgi:hypothetical protein